MRLELPERLLPREAVGRSLLREELPRDDARPPRAALPRSLLADAWLRPPLDDGLLLLRDEGLLVLLRDEGLLLLLLRDDGLLLPRDDEDLLLLREAPGFSPGRAEEERLLREAPGLSLRLDDCLLRDPRLLPLEALARPLERLLLEDFDDFDEPALLATACELLVSPRSERSLFTVRAAISAARPFCPRFW